MQYFKTAQLYFKSIIDQFDILAISEHSLFEEQLGILKTITDGTYNYHAVSASDNPRIISGEQAHGGVALLWKYSVNDFVTPIKSIQSDRIVGIKCEFSGCRPLFILGVYLPSSNHTLDEFQECLDLIWALYESLSADGFVIVVGDVNGSKPGVCGFLLDYKHIRYAGPPLWNLLFILYQECFFQFSVPKNIKKGIILPLFKGKGEKANNKNSYRGITLFPTLCKIYEMVLLNRLEKFAADRDYFSELQFGFREGVGCIEASFTILETINHMLERGSKVFSCFLDVRKAFDTAWIDGLLYKLFNDLAINGRMWLAIKDLYTDVKAQVLYSGELSREFDVSQGTGQGRTFVPFMYKVYINSLLQKLSNHCYAISINSLSLPAPSFADDVTLLALFPSFLKTFLNICHQYSVTWR